LNTSIILDEAVILTEVFTYSVHTVAARNIYGIAKQIRYMHKTVVHSGPYRCTALYCNSCLR
jgi:hypothetical protein